MKNLIIMLLVAPAFSFAATIVDNSRVNSGIVSIDISGGKGSQAEVLYNSLTQVTAQDDDAMGGRHGQDKQGQAIDCSVENDSYASNAYTCTISVSTKGDSLSPGA